MFGGNFLHSLDIGLQLSIYALEKRMGVAQRQQFPFFEEMNWRAAHKFVLRWRVQRGAIERAAARAEAAATLASVTGGGTTATATSGGGSGAKAAVASASSATKRGRSKAVAAAPGAALSEDSATLCSSWLSRFETEGLKELSCALQEWLDRPGSESEPHTQPPTRPCYLAHPCRSHLSSTLCDL